MLYRILTVPNLGYVHPNAEAPIITPVEIALLDNGPGEEIVHLGYAYPDMSGVTVHRVIEADDGPVADKRLLVAYEGDELTEGEALAAEDVVALLVSDYGWPIGTTLDDDGRPVAPVEG